MTVRVTLSTIDGIPLVKPGDDLAAFLIAALDKEGRDLRKGDIVVVAQKIVSKAEGRQLELSGVSPSLEARVLARQTGKDPRLMEAVLRESREVVRSKPGVVVVEHRLGHVLANAGIDHSNVDGGKDEDTVLLLPENPDVSAAQLKRRLDERYQAEVGVVISDSVGRAWRLGTVGIALGLAGIPALEDRRGDPDLFGRELMITITGFADAVAAAATMVMGEADEATPAVVISGLHWAGAPATASDLLRPREEDMFR
ncbi:MAG: coenzyme F420-0:L-glutamate ligase [Pseudomonadota bacterium]|nr:coenzyme F420-0:L-glutamate ligase [Pseudomonadota bacterium]